MRRQALQTHVDALGLLAVGQQPCTLWDAFQHGLKGVIVYLQVKLATRTEQVPAVMVVFTQTWPVYMLGAPSGWAAVVHALVCLSAQLQRGRHAPACEIISMNTSCCWMVLTLFPGCVRVYTCTCNDSCVHYKGPWAVAKGPAMAPMANSAAHAD